jgi:hypothetical protein
MSARGKTDADIWQKLVVSPLVPSGQEIAEYISQVLREDGLHSEAAGITIDLVHPMNEEELNEFEGEG